MVEVGLGLCLFRRPESCGKRGGIPASGSKSAVTPESKVGLFDRTLFENHGVVPGWDIVLLPRLISQASRDHLRVLTLRFRAVLAASGPSKWFDSALMDRRSCPFLSTNKLFLIFVLESLRNFILKDILGMRLIEEGLLSEGLWSEYTALRSLS